MDNGNACEVSPKSIEVTKEPTDTLEPRTPTSNGPTTLLSFDSDSSLSEEEITQKDTGIIAISPLSNPYNDKMKIDHIVDSRCSDSVSDEEIKESMYQDIMRIVISDDIWCCDGCKTPPSKISKSDMSPDTCPGAPMKLTRISRNIDSGFRRKLF